MEVSSLILEKIGLMLHESTHNLDAEIVSQFHYLSCTIFENVSAQLPIYSEDLKKIRTLLDMINDALMEIGEEFFVVTDNLNLIQFCYDYTLEIIEADSA